MSLRPWLAAGLCLWASQAADADQTKVFEWRGTDGVVSFSNVAPPIGAKGVTSREVDTVSLTPAQRLAVQARLARLDATERNAANRFRDRIEAADRAIDASLRRLVQSETALRDGRTPRAGDRVGNDGRYSRLRAEYFARQDRLAAAAQAAREQLAAAYRQREGISP